MVRMKSIQIALIVFIGISVGTQASIAGDRLFGTVTEDTVAPFTETPPPPSTTSATTTNEKLILLLPTQATIQPNQSVPPIDNSGDAEGAEPPSLDVSQEFADQTGTKASKLYSDAMAPQMDMLFSQLSKLASFHRHRKLTTGASDQLSCMGIESVIHHVDDPGLVEYVDPKSDLYSRLEPGDLILTIDGETNFEYYLAGHNYGNANTIAEVVVRHKNGITEQLACQRHPISYFSSDMQRGLLPFSHW